MSFEISQNTSEDTLNATTSRPLLFFHAIGTFLMAVIVTLLFWAILPSSFLQSDPTDYLTYYKPVARNILSGVGFVRPDGALAINNPPGYPILLAGVFSSARIVGLSEDNAHSTFTLLCFGLSSAFVFLLSEK